MTDFDLKYEFGKYVPVTFRGAVLHKFEVDVNGEGQIQVHLSYYHFKTKNILSITSQIDPLELSYARTNMIRRRSKQLMYQLRKAASNAKLKPSSIT